jgi:cobalamin-dependent methionine synthase I
MKKTSSLLIIGQDMHIMNPALFQSLENRDRSILAQMARKQVKAGVHALDLNLGPAKKSNQRFPWVVETIQKTVNVPLFISSRVLAQPETLNQLQKTATINSVTADPETLAADMEKAKKYSARLVVLLVRPGLTPFSVDERLQVAGEVLETASRINFPFMDLYLDPLFHIHPDPVTWQLSRGLPDIDSVLETIRMLPQLAGENINTLVALSSASQFLPPAERTGLHRRLLPLLAAAGLNAVILNAHDSRLMKIALNPLPGMKNTAPVPQANPELDAATLSW